MIIDKGDRMEKAGIRVFAIFDCRFMILLYFLFTFVP
jgi:hypothetical protein